LIGNLEQESTDFSTSLSKEREDEKLFEISMGGKKEKRTR
jgi:hypothetical protein